MIYLPAHQRQLDPADPNGRFNCTAYALAMAIDAVTVGGLVVPGRTVRELSSEPRPDPRSPGLNLRQARAVGEILRVPFEDRTGHTWSELLADLDEGPAGSGRRVVLQLDRDPDACSRFDRGHAMVLYAHRERGILAGDPLCGGPRWYDLDKLHAAARRFARRSGVAHGLRYVRSARIVPPIVRLAA